MTLEYTPQIAAEADLPLSPDALEIAEVRRVDETTWAVLRAGTVVGFVERSGRSYVGLVGAAPADASWVGQYSSAGDALDAVFVA